MLGTLLVFCASLWAILWYLTYDNNRDNLNDHETGKQEQHPALGKKRSRKKHGEKRGIRIFPKGYGTKLYLALFIRPVIWKGIFGVVAVRS